MYCALHVSILIHTARLKLLCTVTGHYSLVKFSHFNIIIYHLFSIEKIIAFLISTF